jgi:hypothetical protein
MRGLRDLTCAVAVAALLAIGSSTAQDYPTRPITLIAPYAAGGPTDVMARIVTGHTSRTLGQRLIIENVLGAGGRSARPGRCAPSPMVTPSGTEPARRRVRNIKATVRLKGA